MTESKVLTSAFTGVRHNTIKNFLMALKADSVADEAIRSYREGEKPLVASYATLNAFLDWYRKEEGLRDGD